MSDKIIKLKIDVSKIDKAKLFKGEKGTYLDATLFYNEATDTYGNNGMITQDVSKEERAAGVKGAILGNCKEFQQANRLPTQQAAAPKTYGGQPDPLDDLPF